MSSIHDPRYRKAIQKLIDLRESKKITQVKLATSLKKPQSYIAKVENCERRLDFIELYDWLKVLDENFNSLEKIFEEV
ncbi:MAG: helix-turn-helix transcriptional regulator [Candidatus Acinetobacter avistercoris]|nr:helix-turn-helix transcriptional regulator [Candidatus Acinetobacter avistercoris]